MLPEMPQLDGVRHSHVKVNGFKMHVAEAGANDGRPVVLYHGWPQAWWIWRKLIPVLAGAGYRVLAPDLRGHGWSETPGGGYSKAQFADDLIKLLDELEIETTLLVGHDWGAMAGFIASIEHPERIERYFALGIVPPFPSRSPRAALHIWRLYYQLLLAAPGTDRLLRRPKMFTDVILPGGITRKDGFTQFDLELYAKLLTDPSRTRVSQHVYRTWVTRELGPIAAGKYADRRLTVPTRVLVGEDDPVCKPHMIQATGKYADDFAWEVLPGVGHFVPEEAPAETAERVLDFFG